MVSIGVLGVNLGGWGLWNFEGMSWGKALIYPWSVIGNHWISENIFAVMKCHSGQTSRCGSYVSLGGKWTHNINMTGIDKPSFIYMLHGFGRIFQNYHQNRKMVCGRCWLCVDWKRFVLCILTGFWHVD